MINVFTATASGLSPAATPAELHDDVVWIDILTPTSDEESLIERFLGLDVPTREEMQEIELSNRLYTENEANFMTAVVLSHTDADDLRVSPVTLIRIGDRLVTVRYDTPRVMDAFIARCSRSGTWTADTLATGLISAHIERIADVLERVSGELDQLSTGIFLHPPAVSNGGNGRKPRKPAARDYRTTLEGIGRKGDVISKVRDSLVSFQRLVTHYISVSEVAGNPTTVSELRSIGRDCEALREHAGYMSQKVTLLLDATLGLINIEQNSIIKIFSVAAVIFLPPTLIASIYGMNFEHMPELQLVFGYPLALVMMVVSAILPYWFFKSRGWL